MAFKTSLSRRNFILKSATTISVSAALGWLFFKKEKPKANNIKTSLSGASFKSGHLLRGFQFPETSETIEVKWAIVGGGISGLSAARWLQKNGESDCLLIELESKNGGNSRSGSNENSKFPQGAHYLPIANNSNKDLLDFLKEVNIIENFDQNGLPIYNDYFLCHDPEERLYVKGHWQEGLWPKTGLKNSELDEIERFKSLVEELKHKIGSDGKEIFALPIDESSSDETFRALDKITFEKYLEQEKFVSVPLHWYADYCCRDDYGTSHKETSAWAGLHYFACRKGKASNANSEAVITWPEGNGWLVEKLEENLSVKFKKDTLVYQIEIEENKVVILGFSPSTKKVTKIIASKCIVTSPQFINQRIVKRPTETQLAIDKHFSYAPWMVANILVNNLDSNKNKEIHWDNVFYQSKSLGYINANHQNLDILQTKKTLSLYWPLSHIDPKNSRIEAINRTEEEWKVLIIKELKQAHKKIEDNIEQIDIWLWGHGMIRPTPGFIWGNARQIAKQSIDDKLFFANSDLSGISVFEEAFYQGISAAKQALANRR